MVSIEINPNRCYRLYKLRLIIHLTDFPFFHSSRRLLCFIIDHIVIGARRFTVLTNYVKDPRVKKVALVFEFISLLRVAILPSSWMIRRRYRTSTFFYYQIWRVRRARLNEVVRVILCIAIVKSNYITISLYHYILISLYIYITIYLYIYIYPRYKNGYTKIMLFLVFPF